MTRIAIVAPTSLPAPRANTLQVMKMAQALAGLGHEVRLAAPGGPPADWEQLQRFYGLTRRFPVEWLAADPRWRRYDYGWQALRWARGWGAELLYTRLPQAAALASLAGFPTIYEVHDLPGGLGGRLLFRLALRGGGLRRLVVITRALAQALALQMGAPAGPPLTCIMPDGVDLERYAALPDPQASRQQLTEVFGAGGLDPLRPAAGYSGNFYAGRGEALLLELAAGLPEVNFLLVGGSAADVQRLLAEAARRGLGNLRLTGFVPNADLPRYQAACDFLLMPYSRQVAASSGGDIAAYFSPLKLFEYLACGRVILSTDLPALREVLTAENAMLLPPDDPAAWIAALRLLLADPARCAALSGNARRAAAVYTWERRAAALLEGLGENGRAAHYGVR